MKACIQSGYEQGQLTEREATDLAKAYDNFLKDTGSPAAARSLLLDLLNAEIEQRKRIAFLADERRKTLIEEIEGFRDNRGQADLPFAFRLLHERIGHEGLFQGAADDGRLIGISAEDHRQAIIAEIYRDIEEATHELGPGWLAGDKRRTSKVAATLSPKAARTQARMREVVKAMRGEATDDAKAKELAKILMDTAEKLRLRFNRAGGMIGKLEGWGGPQHHNPEALLNAKYNGLTGREAWVEYMMQDGMLDRDRMLHPLTEKPYTDTQMRETLAYIWEKIVTDGYSDREITGAPVGRGAIWKQHADHRVLHFKSADAWMRYARDFANPDPFAAMMAHFETMARDIAHMEKFGPNPQVMRQYMKNLILSRAHTFKPVERIVAEQAARMKALVSQMSQPDPEYTATVDRIGEIHTTLASIRRKHTPQLGGRPSQWNKARIAALDKELLDLELKLSPYLNGQKDMGINDVGIVKEIQSLSEAMRDPIVYANTDNPIEYAQSSVKFTDFVWEMMRGSSTAPLVVRVPMGFGWKPDIGRGFDTVRNVITASSLHSAVLSAVSDPVFGSLRRAFIGMSQAKANPIRVLGMTLKAAASETDKRYAARSAVVADSVIRGFQESSRMVGAIDMRRFSGYVAERVIALQGLSVWTRGGKVAFGLEFMGWMADNAGKVWKDLPSELRDTLQRSGFTDKTWDQIRAAKLDEPKPGATFLRPNEIAEVSADLAHRYTSMILRETRYAVPEVTHTAKAMMLGGTTPGSVGGVLARSFSQFKSFGFTVAMLHLGQVMTELHGGRKVSAVQYAGLMLIYGSLMGALAMGLKDINAGRDPRKMFDDDSPIFLDPNFWAAAMLQAGGLGIYGDFFFSQLNRFGGSLPGTVAGPIWGRLDNIKNLTIGNLAELAQGKETKFGKELTTFLRQNTPAVVMTKLMMERMVFDQMQMMLDKDARAAFRRQLRSRKREYGQDFWWQPGSTAPSRAPDLSRIGATR